MRILILAFTFILFSTFLNAQKVEITADSFEADEKEMVTKFNGNIHIKKGEDEIFASELIIYFDKDNKPQKYEATGNIKFHLTLKKQKFEGHSQIIVYEPISQKYKMSGDAYVHEIINDRKLYGEEIVIDRISGKSKIVGKDDKPVRMIFSVEEKK